MFRIIKIALILILFNSIFSSCKYNTEERVNKTSKIFPNGNHLTVYKINRETTSNGVFSGTTYSFTYNVSIDPGDINWNSGSGEPKYILFYKDTTYIRYLKEKFIIVEPTDSIGNIESDNTYRICEVFQKHIDKRQLFKLLGDEYWVDITEEEYNLVKASCNEFAIPNDNKLHLPIQK